jgi:CheY-like chemotaxis protein
MALATDGKTAIELAEKNAYDLIFMDVGLPMMDGLDVTKEIRKLKAHCNTPIIAVTAHAFETDIQRCRDASMNDVLIKPITIAALKNVLSTWGRGS